MICLRCRTVNSNGSRFCNNCGYALKQSSQEVSFDHTSILQKNIPAELAKKILSARAQIESERRLVAVMFADGSGFTTISEKLRVHKYKIAISLKE